MDLQTASLCVAAEIRQQAAAMAVFINNFLYQPSSAESAFRSATIQLSMERPHQTTGGGREATWLEGRHKFARG